MGLFFNHLGSSSLITNLAGEIVQHIEYVPFGEVFIEERNNKWNTPFLFNAKELDEETGLYYYGARYYDPRTSIWISTDPLQEKYPNISTYAYTFQNPVKFIDPDGMQVTDPPIKVTNSEVADAYLQQNSPNWAEEYANAQAQQAWSGLKHGLQDLAKSLAWVRLADEDDPKTISEWWEGMKNAPQAIYDTYTGGSTENQVRLTVGLLGLLRGKTKGAPKGIVLASTGNNTNKVVQVVQIIKALKPEGGYLGSKKHGINWKEGLSEVNKTKIPQGQWSKSDLEFAGKQAATLKPREGQFFDLPKGSTSVVHMPDGTTKTASRIWVRNNGSGTFHGYPLE